MATTTNTPRRNPSTGRIPTGLAAAGLTLCLAAGVAAASDGFDWVTIGDPGNRGARADEVVDAQYNTGRGSVDYSFRMMKTLVTNEQYMDFLLAYAPHWQYRPASTELTGVDIELGPDGRYVLRPGTDRLPADPSIEMAMRLANWLHNGRASGAAAFESGAYDMSTLVKDETGRVLSDSVVRQVGARYWLPNLDEWYKAVYWDPAADTYWSQPNSSHTALMPGQPGEPGAERIDPTNLPWLFRPPVESFPDTKTPWGLLDVSGLAAQGTDEPTYSGSRLRHLVGSGSGDWLYATTNDVFGWTGIMDIRGGAGIRLATSVPSAGAAWLLAFGGVVAAQRRRWA